MMTFQPQFIPLCFDEAEEDIWLALQRVEPEKRSSFIKETLRQVLLGTNREELFRHPLQKVSEDIEEIHDDSNYLHEDAQAEEVVENVVETIEAFSLEDLFAQTDVRHSDEEPEILTDREEVKSIPNRSMGYEYMMKHIIGTEEDEAVLKALSQRPNQSQKPEVRILESEIRNKK